MRITADNPYTAGLERDPANFIALSPMTFLERAASIWPERTAIVHGAIRRDRAETYRRCWLLAGALRGRGIGKRDTVAIIAANTLGEVFLRGNNVMKGYLKNQDATVEAFTGGWFHTGDLGVWHRDGYLEIKDRSKDIIISGGENISSIEIEDVLYSHPAVLEAAIVARPDEKWGETPCAFVALKDGGIVTEADIIAFCRERMAHFKVPKTIAFTPLPKTATGKIQKFILRQRARQL
jgi:acyl-CoA synthetase (AMP-forming)/AMP-acid ligase II